MMRVKKPGLNSIALALLAACASASPSTATDRASTTDPSTEWRRMMCQACTGKSVLVEHRRSIAWGGGPGSYTLVRVTNQNEHAVVVGLSLYESELTLDGEGAPRATTPVHVILRAAGDAEAHHEIVVAHRVPRVAVLHGADRY